MPVLISNGWAHDFGDDGLGPERYEVGVSPIQRDSFERTSRHSRRRAAGFAVGVPAIAIAATWGPLAFLLFLAALVVIGLAGLCGLVWIAEFFRPVVAARGKVKSRLMLAELDSTDVSNDSHRDAE